MADLFAHLCVMFYCDFVTFPCGIVGKIVSISDLCLLSTGWNISVTLRFILNKQYIGPYRYWSTLLFHDIQSVRRTKST